MDRRQYDREPTNLRVYARVPAQRAHVLHARDISTDGVFLEGWVNPPPCGTELSIAFVIETGSTVRLLHRRARIARRVHGGLGLVHSPASPPARRTALSPWSSLRWPEVD